MNKPHTHEGWQGIDQSNKEIYLRSIEFWRLEEGKRKKNWVMIDILDIYDQIGVDVLGRLREFNKAKKFFSILPQNTYILWNDGPKLKKIHQELSKMNLSPIEKGKGRNIWYCMGFVISLKDSGSVAMHDCDIVTYNKNLVAKLFYPVANPKFSFDFCKGFYPRVAHKTMNGRVTRLLVTPLVKSLQKMVGYNEYLNFLDIVKYPLAGEF